MPKKEYHSGFVRDNNDPLKRGRLLIECPDIAYGQTLSWAEPKFHFVDSERQAGSFWVPNIRSVVEVEIEAENDSEATSLEPKWRCDVYPEGTVPEVFRQNYPNRRGWVTAEGHVLFFDDTDGSLEFYYEHPTGTYIKVDNLGNIRLDVGSGCKVYAGEAAATEAALYGTSFVSQLNTFLTALNTFVTSLSAIPGQAGPAATFAGAIATLIGQLPNDLAEKVNVK